MGMAVIDLQGLLFQVGVTVLLYPFIHVIITRVGQIFVESAER